MIVVDVSIVVSSPSPIEFSQLEVHFSESAYDAFCVIAGKTNENDDEDGVDSPLFLEPGVVKAYRFHFSPRSEDVGGSLRITSVSLHLGDPAKRCVVLTWNEGGGDVMSSTGPSMTTTTPSEDPNIPQTTSAPGFRQRTPPNRKLRPEEEWRFIPRGPTFTKLESRSPRVAVTVSHAPPCLVNEFYVVNVSVVNEEEVSVTDLTFSVDLINAATALESQSQQTANTIGDSTQLFVDIAEDAAATSAAASRIVDVPMPDLDAGQSCVKTVYVKATQPGERKFAVLVNYAIETQSAQPTSPVVPLHPASNVIPATINADSSASESRRCLCLASADLSMQATRPFQIVTKPLSMNFEATETVFDKEPFLLTCDVRCMSEWPIEIKTSHLQRSEMMLLPEGVRRDWNARNCSRWYSL